FRGSPWRARSSSPPRPRRFGMAASSTRHRSVLPVAPSRRCCTRSASGGRQSIKKGNAGQQPRSEGARRFQHLGDMSRHPDLAPSAADGPLLVDQERAALDAYILASVHAFLDPDAVFLADVRARIGRKNERELVLLLELVVRCDRILRDPDHHRPRPAVIRESVAKSARFRSAARGVVLRVKIEDDVFALELGQGHAAVAVGGQSEIRGFFTDLDTHRGFSPFRAARRAGCSINWSYQQRTRAAASVISASSRAKSTAPTQAASVAASGSSRSPAAGNPSPSRVRTAWTLRNSAAALASSSCAFGGSSAALPSAA